MESQRPTEAELQDAAQPGEMGARPQPLRPQEYEEWRGKPIRGGAEQLARGLGWLSLGLGIAMAAVPGRLARWIGIQDDITTRTLMRLVGALDVACGAGLVTSSRPAGWMKAKTAGDAMDLGFLGAAYFSGKADKNRAILATAAVAGLGVVDMNCAQWLDRAAAQVEERAATESGAHLWKAITVNRSPEEAYRFWRDFQNLPRFMDRIESIQVIDERRSHWVVKVPGARTIELGVETIEDRPNEAIAWRSVEGSPINHSGSVRFVRAPGGRGTEVHFEVQYEPPGGPIGETLSKFFGKAFAQEMWLDLRAFKQLIETGEIVRSEATLGGARVRQHPARPPVAA